MDGSGGCFISVWPEEKHLFMDERWPGKRWGFSGTVGTGRSCSRLYTGRAAKREKSRAYFTSRRQKLSRAIHMKQKIYRRRMPTEKKKDMEWSTRPPPTPIMEEAVSVNSPEGDWK